MISMGIQQEKNIRVQKRPLIEGCRTETTYVPQLFQHATF